MKFDKIIIATNAPRETGLPWFYCLAMKDLLGENRVAICPEEDRDYNPGIFQRGKRKIKNEIGVISSLKRKAIEQKLTDGMNFVLIFNTAELNAEDILKLSNNPKIKLGVYYSDHPLALVPAHQKVMKSTITFYDIIFTFSPNIAPILYQLGARSVGIVPFGYCRYTHLPAVVDDPSPKLKDVTYFGTWTPVIEEWLIPLIDLNLRIEGNGWTRSSNKEILEIVEGSQNTLNDGMIKLAGESNAVVNFTRAPHGCFHTMKTFELAIAKAAISANYSPEQASHFKNKESFLYFNTKKEMVENISLLIGNSDLNMELRRNAFENARPFDYHNRAEMLINEFNKVLM